MHISHRCAPWKVANGAENPQGRGVTVYATIFEVYTVILYSLHVSVVRQSSAGHICIGNKHYWQRILCFFGMLVNVVDKGDRFLVTVDAVAVVQLTVACSGRIWVASFWCCCYFWFFIVSWIPLVSWLAFSCRLAEFVTPWYITETPELWSHTCNRMQTPNSVFQAQQFQ
jgi:hypothetical protein